MTKDKFEATYTPEEPLLECLIHQRWYSGTSIRNESWPQGETTSWWRTSAPRARAARRCTPSARCRSASRCRRRPAGTACSAARPSRLRERLVVVHHPRQVEIGVRVEALEEDLRLVVEVVLDLEVRRQRHRRVRDLALAVELAPQRLVGDVRDVGHHARDVHRVVGRGSRGARPSRTRCSARSGAPSRRPARRARSRPGGRATTAGSACRPATRRPPRAASSTPSSRSSARCTATMSRIVNSGKSRP